MSERKTYRIGIDVGGTFTKAVLIDNAGLEVVGRFSVMTTHSDARGVAAGVVEVFRNVLERVVASSAFGVDDQSAEEMVMRIAAELGLAVTGGHEITKLYGLTTRTRTAVINASILPKMIGTANMTEEAVREAGIDAPLMIMRGDGGVMNVQEMRRRPVVTMLSGPAASVAGALMYLRVSDGIYFEVGGTSTNIGVIRDGRPTIKHARVGGHDTYVNSLDVRVIGIAGGSMVRLRGNDIHDVGPRSAHIAGLHYAAFAKPEDIADPQIELFRPKDGDPGDYLAIRCSNGERYALTTTCAANILGYAKPGWHAHGNAESAGRAFAPLAQRIGTTIEEAARRILVKAAAKVTDVRVFQAEVTERKWRVFTTRRTPVRAVDREGVIRIQRSDGVVTQTSASNSLRQLRSLWESVTIYNGDSVIAPDLFVVAGCRIVDLCGIAALDQAIAISRGELEGMPPEAPVVLIGMQGARGL